MYFLTPGSSFFQSNVCVVYQAFFAKYRAATFIGRRAAMRFSSAL